MLCCVKIDGVQRMQKGVKEVRKQGVFLCSILNFSPTPNSRKQGHSLPELICNCLLEASIDVRPKLASNIVVCGGMASVPGLAYRLQQELLALLQQPRFREVRGLAAKLAFSPLQFPPSIVPWVGASVVCNAHIPDDLVLFRQHFTASVQHLLPDWSVHHISRIRRKFLQTTAANPLSALMMKIASPQVLAARHASLVAAGAISPLAPDDKHAHEERPPERGQGHRRSSTVMDKSELPSASPSPRPSISGLPIGGLTVNVGSPQPSQAAPATPDSSTRRMSAAQRLSLTGSLVASPSPRASIGGVPSVLGSPLPVKSP